MKYDLAIFSLHCNLGKIKKLGKECTHNFLLHGIWVQLYICMWSMRFLLKCLAVIFFFFLLNEVCSYKPVYNCNFLFFFTEMEVTSRYSAFYWFMSLGNEWRCGFYARFSAMFACFWQCELWFLFYICINIYLCIIVNIFWILFVSNILVWEGVKRTTYV